MGFISFHNDHGLLTGLADDDHTQYVLRSILTTNGDLFSREAGSISRIADVATGSYLASGGVGVIPAWATLNQAAVAGLTTASTPTFAGVLLSGLSASVPVVTDASKNLASQTYASFKTSLVLAQADVDGLTTASSPTFAGLTAPTINGGIAANDDITIQGTTHATRTSSYVLLQPNGGLVGIAMTPAARLDVSGTIRATGIGNPTSGVGIEYAWDGTNGYMISYDRSALAYKPLRLAGSTINIGAANADNVFIDASGNVGIGTTGPTISGTGKLHMGADTFRLDTARTPASAGAVGNAGDICWDASFIYVCTATNAWERVAIASW